MSKNNWTKTVAAINREKYTVPEGWDTREKVAADLQCAPDRVADLLKPGLQSGQIERNTFGVWDDARRLTTQVVCYRIAVAGEAKEEATGATRKGVDAGERKRVTRALKRNPERTDRLIAKNNRSTVAVVSGIRKALKL